MLILYYIIFFFLILRFTVTLFNFISNPKLTSTTRRYTDLVSILIPARDEEEDILNLLKSIGKQSYQHIEVIILDDHSSDNTYRICNEYAKANHQVRVVKGKALPDGWLGKNFACWQLAGMARGRYLMFLDADDTISEGLINNSVHRMKMNRLALLSLFANQVTQTLGERIVVPLMHFILLNLLPLRLVRLSSNPAFAAASGQFMLFDADNYNQNQWHTQVKNKVVEDIEIMKLVKANGFKGETLLANGFIKCRMYKNFEDSLQGFSKNLLAGFNNNIAGLLCYLILVILGPVFIALYLDASLLFFAIALIILSRVMIAFSSGQSAVLNILLHPLQMISLIVISILSVKKYLTKSVTWKGRIIQP